MNSNITVATNDTPEGQALLNQLRRQYGVAAVEAELERSHGRIALLNGAPPVSLVGRAHWYA